MSTDSNEKATRINPPWLDSVGSATASTVLYLATATTHAQLAIPADWRGKAVIAQATTTPAYVLFTNASGEEVDRSDTAAGTTLGFPLVVDVPYFFVLPRDATHLVAEAAASGALYLVLTESEDI